MISPFNSDPIGSLVLNLALQFAMISTSMVHIGFFHAPPSKGSNLPVIKEIKQEKSKKSVTV
jgi:hypothetical protein